MAWPCWADVSATWALAVFVGTAAALIVPAHIVIALLALVGVGSVWTIRIVQSLARHATAAGRSTDLATDLHRDRRRRRRDRPVGTVTGHGVGEQRRLVERHAVQCVLARFRGHHDPRCGCFLAIPVAWFLVRREASIEADLYLGTVVLLVAGALVWGARLG